MMDNRLQIMWKFFIISTMFSNSSLCYFESASRLPACRSERLPRLLKIKKRLKNKKTLTNVKYVTKIKKNVKQFFYIYGQNNREVDFQLCSFYVPTRELI